MVRWFRFFQLLRGNAAICFRGWIDGLCMLFLFLTPSLAICVTEALLRESACMRPYSILWFVILFVVVAMGVVRKHPVMASGRRASLAALCNRCKWEFAHVNSIRVTAGIFLEFQKRPGVNP